MRPTPIPDRDVYAGSFRAVLSGPSGDLTDPNIAPVEVLFDRGENTGMARALIRCELEPGDLDKLTAGGTIWLAFYGQVPVFCLDVKGPDE